MPIDIHDYENDETLYGDDSPFNEDEVKLMNPMQKKRLAVNLQAQKEKARLVKQNEDDEAAAKRIFTDSPDLPSLEDLDPTARQEKQYGIDALPGFRAGKQAIDAVGSGLSYVNEGLAELRPHIDRDTGDFDEGEAIRSLGRFGMSLVELGADVADWVGIGTSNVNNPSEAYKQFKAGFDSRSDNVITNFAADALQWVGGWKLAGKGFYQATKGAADSSITRKVLAGAGGSGVASFVAFDANETNLLEYAAEEKILGLDDAFFIDAVSRGNGDSNLEIRAKNAFVDVLLEVGVAGLIAGGVKAAGKVKASRNNRQDGTGADTPPETPELDGTAGREKMTFEKATAIANAVFSKQKVKAHISKYLFNETQQNDNAILEAVRVKRDLAAGYDLSTLDPINNGTALYADSHTGTADIGRGRSKVGNLDNGEVHMPADTMRELLDIPDGKDKYAIEGEIRAALNNPNRVSELDDGGQVYEVYLPTNDRLVVELSPKASASDNMRQVRSVRYDSEELPDASVLFEKKPKPGSVQDTNYRMGMVRYLSRKANRLAKDLEVIKNKDAPFRDRLQAAGVDEKFINFATANLRITEAESHLLETQQLLRILSKYSEFRNDILTPETLRDVKRIARRLQDSEENFAESLAIAAGKTPIESSAKPPVPKGEAVAGDIKDLPKTDDFRDYKNFFLYAKGQIDNRAIGKRYGSEGKARLFWFNIFKGVYPSNHPMAAELRQIYDQAAKQPGFFKAATKAGHDHVVNTGTGGRSYLDAIDTAEVPELASVSGDIDETQALRLAADEHKQGGYASQKEGVSEARVAFDEFHANIADEISQLDLPDPKDFDTPEAWYSAYREAYIDATANIRHASEPAPTGASADDAVADTGFDDDVLNALAADFGGDFTATASKSGSYLDELREFDEVVKSNEEAYGRLFKDEGDIAAHQLGIDPEKLRAATSADDLTEELAKGLDETITRGKGWGHIAADGDEAMEILFDNMRKVIEANKPKSVSMESIQASARKMFGRDAENIIKAMDSRTDGSMDAAAVAGIALTKSVGRHAIDQNALRIQAAGKNPLPDAHRKEFVDNMKVAALVKFKTNQVAREAGRTLSRFRHANKVAANQKFENWQGVLAAMNEKNAQLKAQDLDALTKHMNEMAGKAGVSGDDPAVVAANMAGMFERGTATFTKIFNEGIIKSIISYPAVGVQIVSNTYKIFNKSTRILASGAVGDTSRAIAKMVGREVEGGASVNDFVRFWSNWQKNHEWAMLNLRNAWETGDVGFFNERDFSNSMAELSHGDTYDLPLDPKYKNKVIRGALRSWAFINKINGYTGTKWLVATDAYAQAQVFLANVDVHATRGAKIAEAKAIQTGKSKDEAREAYWEAYETLSDPETTTDFIIQDSSHVAARMTSTQRLPEKLERMTHFVSKTPVLKSILPVFKTIINDWLSSVDESVVGLLKPQILAKDRNVEGISNYAPILLADIAAGGDRKNEALGKLLNTALWFAGSVGAYKSGMVLFDYDNADDYKEIMTNEIANNRAEHTWRLGGMDIQGGRLGVPHYRAWHDNAVFEMITGSTATEQEKQAGFVHYFIELMGLAEQHGALSGVGNVTNINANRAYDNVSRRLIQLSSVSNPTNQIQNTMRLFGIDKVKDNEIWYNPQKGFTENLGSRWQLHWGIEFPPNFDAYGVQTHRPFGWKWVFGASTLRDFNDNEQYVAKFLLGNNKSLTSPQTHIMKAPHLRNRQGAVSSYKMTPKQASYYKSLRGQNIYRSDEVGDGEYRNFADSMAVALKRWEKQGIDEVGRLKKYQKEQARFTTAMKAVFYSEFPEVMDEVGLSKQAMKQYYRYLYRNDLHEDSVFDKRLSDAEKLAVRQQTDRYVKQLKGVSKARSKQ